MYSCALKKMVVIELFLNLRILTNMPKNSKDTLHAIIKLVEKDCLMASIDLKDAYYSVPIATSHRKYL